MKPWMSLYPFLVIMLFFSCRKDEITAPKVEDYFPLKVGNQWKYDVFRINEDGEQFVTTQSVKVIDERNIGGERWFELSVPRDLEFFFSKFVRVDNGQLIDPQRRVLLTLDIGDQVFSQDTIYLSNDLHFNPLALIDRQVGPVRKTINVEAGEYSCLEVINTIRAFPGSFVEERMSFDHYRQGVGLVQKNVITLFNTEIREIRLESFHLK